MTIKDLSRETGYSVGTISRVLNNHPSVSEKARREITAAIERFGFERNENAKNLKQLKNEGILVLVKGRKNELFAAIIERLQQFFDRTSYTMMLDYFDEQEDEVRRAAHSDCKVSLCGKYDMKSFEPEDITSAIEKMIAGGNA